MKNETTAELPSEWKGYAWSTDYQELYDLLKTGVRAVCLAPYRRNIWDICYARFDATYGFDFGARGISYTRSYPSDDHSFEAFEKICKESDIVFLNPDSTTQIAALRSALEKASGLLADIGTVMERHKHTVDDDDYLTVCNRVSKFITEALAATPADPVREAATALVEQIDEDSDSQNDLYVWRMKWYEKAVEAKALAAELTLANKKIELLQAGNDHYANGNYWGRTSRDVDSDCDWYIWEGNGYDFARKTQEEIARLTEEK